MGNPTERTYRLPKVTNTQPYPVADNRNGMHYTKQSLIRAICGLRIGSTLAKHSRVKQYGVIDVVDCFGVVLGGWNCGTERRSEHQQ